MSASNTVKKKRVMAPRVHMPELDAVERSRNFEEVNQGLSLDQAICEAERCIQCKGRPCVNGCPVAVSIPEFILALAWLAVVLSIGSIGLLYWLIRRSAATSVASLFYLVPAVTSLMAYVLFGERLDAVSVAGMVACAAAVLLVNRRSA